PACAVPAAIIRPPVQIRQAGLLSVCEADSFTVPSCSGLGGCLIDLVARFGFRRGRFFDGRFYPSLGQSQVQEHGLTKARNDCPLVRERIVGLVGPLVRGRGLDEARGLKDPEFPAKGLSRGLPEGPLEFRETDRLLEIHDGEDFQEPFPEHTPRDRQVPSYGILRVRLWRAAYPEIDASREPEACLGEDREPLQEVPEQMLIVGREARPGPRDETSRGCFGCGLLLH